MPRTHPLDQSDDIASNNITVQNEYSEATSPLPPQIISPPYWQHTRGQSYASVISNGGKPSPISLEDHTDESYNGDGGICSPLWAKMVCIDDHVVVSGNVKGVGDYVVWICRVDTLDVRESFFISCLLSSCEFTRPIPKGSLPPLCCLAYLLVVLC